jgi:LysM repeat protein
MGQLEKYGLYVLCLVIFLILGVAIWGGDPAPAAGAQMPLAGNPPASRGQPGPGSNVAGNLVRREPRLPTPSTEDAIGKLLQRTDLPVPTAAAVLDPGKAAAPPAGPGGAASAAEPPKAAPAPEATRTKYTIQRGDTLGDIAQKQLGSVAHVEDIKRLNPGLDPLLLLPGKDITLPSKAELAARKATEASSGRDGARPADAAARTDDWKYYKVQRGDTFEGISRRMFHDVRHVEAIKKLNPTLDPRKLQPGMEIKIPVR